MHRISSSVVKRGDSAECDIKNEYRMIKVKRVSPHPSLLSLPLSSIVQLFLVAYHMPHDAGSPYHLTTLKELKERGKEKNSEDRGRSGIIIQLLH